MGTATFDTLKFARRLKAADVPEKQAEAEAEAIKEALSEAMDSQVPTKADMYQMKAEIHEVKAEIQEVKAEQRVMKWMIGFNLAFTLAMFWKMFIG